MIKCYPNAGVRTRLDWRHDLHVGAESDLWPAPIQGAFVLVIADPRDCEFDGDRSDTVFITHFITNLSEYLQFQTSRARIIELIMRTHVHGIY